MSNLQQYWGAQLVRFPMLGKIFSSLGWNVVFRLFHMCVRFYVGARVAQYFGPEKMGVFSSAWASFAILAPLVLGIDAIIGVRLVEKPRGERRHLGTLFAYKCITGFLSILILIGIALYAWLRGAELGVDTYHIVILILGVQFVTQVLDTQTVWFGAKLESKYVAWGNFGGLMFSSIVQLTLVFLGASLAVFAVAVITELLISRCITTYYFWNRGPRMATWKPRIAPVVQIVKEAWPMIIAGMVATIYARMDVLMVRHIAGDHETGIYAAAVRISELFCVVPGMLCAVLMPALVRAKARDAELYKRRLHGLFSLMALFGYMSALVIWLFGEKLISVFYGAEFDASHSILLVYLWAAIPMALGVARASYLVAEGYLTFALLANLLGAFVNLILNLILIPRYGGMGAAVATLVTCLVANVGTTFFYRPVRGVGRLQVLAILFPNPFKISSLSST